MNVCQKMHAHPDIYKCDSEIPRISLTDEERIEATLLAIVFSSFLPIMIAYFAHSAIPHMCVEKLNLMCSLAPGYLVMYFVSIVVYFSAYVKFAFRYVAKQNLRTPSLIMIVAAILYVLTFILSLIPAFFYKVT